MQWRFVLPSKDYTRQYQHLYYQRLVVRPIRFSYLQPNCW